MHIKIASSCNHSGSVVNRALIEASVLQLHFRNVYVLGYGVDVACFLGQLASVLAPHHLSFVRRAPELGSVSLTQSQVLGNSAEPGGLNLLMTIMRALVGLGGRWFKLVVGALPGSKD